jgi:hypothetical protein
MQTVRPGSGIVAPGVMKIMPAIKSPSTAGKLGAIAAELPAGVGPPRSSQGVGSAIGNAETTGVFVWAAF